VFLSSPAFLFLKQRISSHAKNDKRRDDGGPSGWFRFLLYFCIFPFSFFWGLEKAIGQSPFISPEGVAREVFVSRVIDGDTVELMNGEKVRYAGIDAPEIKKKVKGKWMKDPQPYGLAAFQFNRKRVEGRSVYLELDQRGRDDYQRLLGYLFVDGVMVNALMVQEGYARVSLYPPNLKYAVLLLGLQREAWEKQRGIWSVSVHEDQIE
jgi:micrococcal nuclease